MRPDERTVIDDLPDYTTAILEELDTDDAFCKASKEPNAGWWIPKSYDNSHTIFERAYLKFINGNLNYADLKNMIAHSRDPDPYWNPALRTSRTVCELIKDRLKITTPFGRMCLWKLPPKMFLEPHTDNYKYHRHIRRWIYFLTHNEDEVVVTFEGQNIGARKGLLAELQPFEEKHFFANKSDQDWYFLAFDTWKPESLALLEDWKIEQSYAKSPQRMMYLSKH